LSRFNKDQKAPRPKLSDPTAPGSINLHAIEALKVRLDPPTPPDVDCEKRDGPGFHLPTASEWISAQQSPRSPLTTPPEKPNPINDGGSTGETFLLVDDNPINLKMLIMFMKKLKLQYSTASNGQEAVTKYKENPSSYKCVFMDISMPIMNGFEATRHIRTFEAECSIPKCNIFALTGLASRDAQQEAVLSGIDLFLTKPIALAEMKHLLESKELI
jgi:CheY-like chemotaxis protein